ncbi:hypothetical protein N665_0352s0024 [Sinapis alba]|nr:hypothetical protein N665_0352s0024 [Sinapis alba]
MSDLENQTGSIAGDFLPDPLLSNGSFISSPTTAGDGTLGNSATQPPIQVNPSPGQQSESKSRKRSAPLENWLPPGWRVEDKVRTSGATAGAVDKYYLEPITGRKFRSRTEVLYYLEHGTTPKKGSKKAKNTGSNPDHLEGKGSKKSSIKAKEQPPPPLPPLKFDFENAPEKVSWCMENAGDEAWIPFVGDDKVQDSVRRDWGSAFTIITTKNPSR